MALKDPLREGRGLVRGTERADWRAALGGQVRLGALTDPDLVGHVAPASDFPDDEQQQLRNEQHGDEAQDANALGEETANAAEILLPEGQHDPQCRQRHEDERVGQDGPDDEDHRHDLEEERKSGHPPRVVCGLNVVTQHMQLQIVRPLMVELDQEQKGRAEEQALDIRVKKAGIRQHVEGDRRQADEQAGIREKRGVLFDPVTELRLGIRRGARLRTGGWCAVWCEVATRTDHASGSASPRRGRGLRSVGRRCQEPRLARPGHR